MKRLALRFAAAVLAAVAGVSVVALLPSRPAPPSPDRAQIAARLQPAHQPRPAQSPAPSEEETDPLEASYVKDDRLSYAGYDIERSVDDATGDAFGQSSAVVKMGGKVLAVHESGGMGKESTQFGLFPFLGGETKQLVVMQYTGGAHCCWIYHIYDFSPRLRPIFDGQKYGADRIGYELRPEDIDGDGRFEFTQAVMTFDYFHTSHAASVFPPAVFAYDEQAQSYLPANRQFSSYVLRGLEKDLQRVEEERAKVVTDNTWMNESYLGSVLRVTLNYIYAGREAEGWEFYEREYHLSNKDEVRADLRKALKGDPIYQSIYRPTTRRTRTRGSATDD